MTMFEDDRIVVEYDVPGCDGSWDCEAIQHIDGCYGIPWNDVCDIALPGSDIDHVVRCTRVMHHSGAHQGAGKEKMKTDQTLPLCQEALHEIQCVYYAGHPGWHKTTTGTTFADSGADSKNPIAAGHSKEWEAAKAKVKDRAQYDVILESHVHKIAKQRTEIRRLNQSMSRLRDLAAGRLDRNQRLQRENNRLAAHLTTATQERDAYKRMLEEANQKLSESGYFIGLGEDN